MSIFRNLALLTVLLLTACANPVSLDYDRNENFANYRTFSLLPVDKHRKGDVQVDNPLLAKRIDNAVIAELTSRGYKLVDSNPDFYVTYHLAVKTEIETRGSSVSIGVGTYGYRGGIGMAYGYPGYEVYSYDKGILTLDILTGKEKKLVWRGSTSRIVNEGATPESTDKVIKEVVLEILDNFPPGYREAQKAKKQAEQG